MALRKVQKSNETAVYESMHGGVESLNIWKITGLLLFLGSAVKFWIFKNFEVFLNLKIYETTF